MLLNPPVVAFGTRFRCCCPDDGWAVSSALLRCFGLLYYHLRFCGIEYGGDDDGTDTTSVVRNSTQVIDHTAMLLLLPWSPTSLCFSQPSDNHGTNPSPNPNPNPYDIPMEVPLNDVTGVKLKKKKYNVHHWGHSNPRWLLPPTLVGWFHLHCC